MGAKETLRVITAEEAANYVVCPEAWRLKYLALRRKKPSSRMEQGKKLRKEWMERQDLSAKLKAYGKIIYALLVVIVIVVFLLEQHRTSSDRKKKSEPAAQETEEANDRS